MVIATARSRSLVSPRRGLAATVEGSGHRGVGLRFVFEPTREVYGASIYETVPYCILDRTVY